MPDKIRFYFDESFMGPVAKGLRLRGIDVVTVEDLGLKGAVDEENLTRAAADERVLATMDDDFLVLHNHTEHWGIVYAPMGERSIGYLVRTLQRIHDEMVPEELRNRVEYI
ncbi:MAG: hypothetical protein AMXMBFR33_68160 [Candidatus Xenobia bacterium]